ncbi:PIN2/TERF1-interacting telomerase inhibitor 1 [Eublepharis macularius]|uniref:PIN2/TERF1-interacting telomerase inhibitor 1 n=1 Tax=Eublepharis macularius TaxID=481883 RepID=A0AA97LG54_EUBMA|nr:PIN2/TERF1-interacting telomerase inhibitor 1 [Eublepharis macularius]
MAMLAEPRRKQKWSVDPRNSAWSKDESKFGQKMLEKMGWSKGKGLGAQEQGSTEHIKVQVKNNNLGLGASVNHEDNWIAHQDDFNQLLADLNNYHGQDGADPVSGEQKKTFNLEEKSKISRKRVHYVKFAKGKDLSSRSEDDLSCIFGKRQKSKKMLADAVDANSLEEDPKVGNDPPEPVDTSNTVTSALTVQEYFAKRMAKLKRAHKGADVSPDPPPVVAEEWEHLGSQSKKKKKSHKHLEPENKGGQEKPKLKSPRMLDSGGEEVGELDREKSKKKSKLLGVGASLTANESQQENGLCFTGTSSVENSDSEVPKPKKKNKKKHKKLNRDVGENVEENTKRKKKKKHSS